MTSDVEVSRRTLSLLVGYANERTESPEDRFVAEAIENANNALDRYGETIEVGDVVR